MVYSLSMQNYLLGKAPLLVLRFKEREIQFFAIFCFCRS